MSTSEAIPVFYSFARSGGTLLNQCLGVTPENAVLSEVNPAACCRSVASQAESWLQLIEPEESAEFAQQPYADQIASLHERARARGRRLVVRDWPTVNFLANTAAAEIVPSGVLEQPYYLKTAGLAQCAIVLTRRATSVFASLRRNFSQLATLDPDEFATSYLAYARAVANYPRFKLEDLTQAPETIVPAIANALGVALAPDFQTTFGQFQQCTGDNTLGSRSAVAPRNRISPSGRRDAECTEVRSHPAIVEADRLFDYEP